MRLISAARTDVGCVREENEDCMLQDEEAAAFGVADGIGGLPFGAEAARCAVDTLQCLLRSRSDDGVAVDLVPIVKRVNEAVLAMARSLSPDKGIGCTLTFGCARGGTITIAHVGDSRCYLLHEGRLEKLTVDHNVEQDPLYRLPSQRLAAMSQASRGALTRCIGQPTALDIDTTTRELHAGDAYLFCTDGITRLVLESEIETTIRREDISPGEMLEKLIALAKFRGGYDNATGVLLQVR